MKKTNNAVFENAKWIVACKIIQSLFGFVIGLISARYLGPSNYGIISYAASIISFALPIMQLGLKHVLVREFVNFPNQEGIILGTALIINIISSLFCVIGIVSFVVFVNAGEQETIMVCTIYSLCLIFQAAEMTQYWFQAKLLSKYPSIASLIAYVVVSLYKVFLLITRKSILWFAFSNVIDYCLISLLLFIVYKKVGTQPLSISKTVAKRLLSGGKYYIIPSLMVVLYQYTDQIMIKLMINETANGLYSAAMACVGVSGFVFTAILDTARPVVLEAKNKGKDHYEKIVIQLYGIITWISLAQCVSMTLLAKPLISIMYGEEYIGASQILAVLVWYITFGYYGSVRNIWVLAENKQKYLTGINVFGAVINVALNLCLIPILGALGAAIASVATQFLTNVVIGFIFAPIKDSNRLMIQGLNPKHTLELVFKILKKK